MCENCPPSDQGTYVQFASTVLQAAHQAIAGATTKLIAEIGDRRCSPVVVVVKQGLEACTQELDKLIQSARPEDAQNPASIHMRDQMRAFWAEYPVDCVLVVAAARGIAS